MRQQDNKYLWICCLVNFFNPFFFKKNDRKRTKTTEISFQLQIFLFLLFTIASRFQT